MKSACAWRKARTESVSQILRCQPNLAPHFDFYRDNPEIFPLLRRPPSGMLIADCKFERRISTGATARRF
jgi:hypothetical protein